MTSTVSSAVEDSVEHLATLHRDHERSTTATQRVANRITQALGRPATFVVIILATAAWTCGNYLATRLGMTALEEFPFPVLAFIATIAAVLIALLILTTQQHQNQLAERRAQLTLQIAVLSEKKAAKIIALIEEQRRESPILASRIDDVAEAMAQSADPQESLKFLDHAT